VNFEQQVVVITGGASGIGKALSLAFAKHGATVVINYNHSQTSAQSLLSEIEAFGGKATIFQADVSSFEQSAALVESVIQSYGKIDCLINNSGITKDNLLMRMTEEDFDQVIDVNLKGAWNMCKHASRYMIKARKGKIINISSVSGLIGNAGQTNYSASKAGLIGLTMSLARELAKRNIQVNAIAPGFIETNMTKSLPEEVISKFMEQIPLSRLGSVDDVAGVALFLASNLSDYMTGQTLRVDGGMVMG